MIEPLRKLKGGKPCQRPPKIEAKLLEFDGVSDAELIHRCGIVSTIDPGMLDLPGSRSQGLRLTWLAIV